MSASSFTYAVWIDRYKYRGRPEVFINETVDGWEILLKNHNAYSIQLLRIGAGPRLRRPPRSTDISASVHGRHEFPFFLQPGETAVIAIDSLTIRNYDRVNVTTSSGRVGWRGRPRKRTFPIQISR